MNGCCAECAHKTVCKVMDTFQTYLTAFDPNTGKCDYFFPEAKAVLPHSIYEVALIDHISGVSQSTYVIEECSELIKELMKEQRGKGSEEDILAEACDVLTTLLVMFIQRGTSEDYIRKQIQYKCERALKRYTNNGEM